jgi:hypothetical protein
MRARSRRQVWPGSKQKSDQLAHSRHTLVSAKGYESNHANCDDEQPLWFRNRIGEKLNICCSRVTVISNPCVKL